MVLAISQPDSRHISPFHRHSWWFNAASSCLLLLSLFTAAKSALADVVSGNPGSYRALLGGLKPGDTLLLSAGTYEEGLPITNLHGQAGKPIVIRGPENGFPAVFLASRHGRWNTIQIKASSYVTVGHLKLDGLGVANVDAVNARGVTHHITIENLKILRHGGSQGTVGIATRGPAWDWVIRNNMIIGAGTGMYLGNPKGIGWPFVGGLIEYNLVINTRGYNIQIKRIRNRYDKKGNAVEGMPSEDRTTIIRHNVFSKAAKASMDGQWARPNLLVGHWPLQGPGSNDRYDIYGNFFYQNPSEALFQGEGNFALHDNVFVNDYDDAVVIQKHKNRPRMIDVFHNTIVAKGTGIRLVNGVREATQRVMANAVFAGTPLRTERRVELQCNATDSYRAAGKYLARPGGEIGSLDLYPRKGQLDPCKKAIPFRLSGDGARDFNGTRRTGTLPGAYAGEGRNPGWLPKLEIKPRIDAVP